MSEANANELYESFIFALKNGFLTDAIDAANALETLLGKGGDVIPDKLAVTKLSALVLADYFRKTSMVLWWAQYALEGE